MVQSFAFVRTVIAEGCHAALAARAIGFVLAVVMGLPLAACGDGDVEMDAQGRRVTHDQETFERVVSELWDEAKESGRIPNGEPGNPFRITILQGDGWRVLDAGPGLRPKLGVSLAWADDTRLLFHARNSLTFQTLAESRQSPAEWAIYDWGVDSGIREYLRSPYQKGNLMNVCIAGDRMVVRTGQGIRRGPPPKRRMLSAYLIGTPFGELEEMIPTRTRGWSWISCDFNALPPEGVEIRGSYVQLRNGHGYLFNPSREFLETDPFELVNPETGMRAALPFTGKNGPATCARYYDFKGAYFVTDCLADEVEDGRWIETGCRAAWWVWPDGRWEEVCIPLPPFLKDAYGDRPLRETYSGVSYRILPMRDGYLVTTRLQTSRTDAGPGGAYYLGPNGARHVLSGFVHVSHSSSSIVSHDGCRTAFGFAPSMAAMDVTGTGPQTVRIFEACGDK